MSSKNKNSVNIFVFSKEVYHSLFKNKFIARDEVVYQYDPNKHLYKQVTNAFMKTYIRKSILNGLISIPEDFGENCVNAITENIKALLDFEDLKENQFFGCALKRNQYFFPLLGTNIEIRIAKNNLAFIEHDSSSSFFTTKTVPYKFDNRAGCKTFIKFLNEVLDSKEILLLQEWFGYTLIPDTRMHKMMIYKGRGRNGKSTIMLLHRLLLGQLNVASIPIKGFAPSEKFLLGITENKLLNQVEEVDSDARLTTSVVKRYISGGIVQGEPKFKMAKDFVATARIEIATNHDVDFEDDSDGFRERLIILPFRRQFIEQDQNKDFIDPNFWIESGELSGVFNWALRGLKRLVENNWNFTKVDSVVKEINEYKTSLNYTVDFINTYLEEAPDTCSLFGIEMYQAYEAHCELYGSLPKKDSAFSKELLNRFSTIKKSQYAHPSNVKLPKTGKKVRSHIFFGVRFKSDTQIITDTVVTGIRSVNSYEVLDEKASE